MPRPARSTPPAAGKLGWPRPRRLAITPAPFRVVDAAGRPDPDLYAIGVATEHIRWFTQVGTGRPGRDSPFCRHADSIARDVLAAR